MSHRSVVSVAVSIATAIALGSGGCGKPTTVWPTEKSGPRIMTSFAPLYCFASQVAGADATVRCLLTTQGPHGFQPTQRDAAMLHQADLFFIVGLDLDERFAKTMQEGADNPKLKIVELGEGLEQKQEADPKGDWLLTMNVSPAHAGHGHGKYDPHVWLGIPQAIFMVEEIRAALSATDPAHQAGYTQRAADYIVRLRKLQGEGMKKLADKKDRNLISFHESLGYFARTFQLNIVDSLEPVAGDEPDSPRIERIVKLCIEKKVRLIAVEPQYPKNTSAQVLLDELRDKGIKDAALVEVDPLETAPPDQLDPDYYEKKMRENLAHLAEMMK